MRFAAENADADRCTLTSLDQHVLRVEASYERGGPPDLVGQEYPMSWLQRQPLLERAVTTGTIVLGGSFGDDGDADPDLAASLLEMRHIAIVPLSVGDAVGAVLILSRRSDRPFAPARAYRAPAGRTARRSGLAERSPRQAGAERATPRAGLIDSDVAGCRDQRGSGGLLRKAELLDFKQSLLELAERRVAVMGDDAGAELRETDLKVLAAEAARFQHRLVFWQRRLREFESASVTNSE